MFARSTNTSNAGLAGKGGVEHGNRTIFFPFLHSLGTLRLDAAAATAGDA